ncbi:MAG: Sporulation and spore germination [Candidatus Parcubacteria bacterium]|jgi:spore germination protein GerM
MKTLNKGFAPIAVILIIVAVLAVGGGAYYMSQSSKVTPTSTETPDYNLPTNQGQNTQQATNITTPQTGTNSCLVITSPTINHTVSFPLNITGYIDTASAVAGTCLKWGAFEGTAGDVVVRDTSGSAKSVAVKIKTVGDYSVGMQHWPIIATIPSLTSSPSTNQIALHFAGDAQADGEIAATKVLTPFTITPWPQPNPTQQQSSTTNIKVYFYNAVSNPGLPDCRINYAVNRSIPQTSAVARASLEKLFAGPTAAESAAGYGSFIQQGVVINSLTITNGVAYLDISKEPSTGGSCGVTGSSMQIKNTLLQFPTIQSYSLTVNGQVLPNDI